MEYKMSFAILYWYICNTVPMLNKYSHEGLHYIPKDENLPYSTSINMQCGVLDPRIGYLAWPII